LCRDSRRAVGLTAIKDVAVDSALALNTVFFLSTTLDSRYRLRIHSISPPNGFNGRTRWSYSDGQKLVQQSSQGDACNGSGNFHPNKFHQSTLRTPLSPWLGSLDIPSAGLVSDGEPHPLDERPTLPARPHELQSDIIDTINALSRSLHPQVLHIPSPHTIGQQAPPHQHRRHGLPLQHIQHLPTNPLDFSLR